MFVEEDEEAGKRVDVDMNRVEQIALSSGDHVIRFFLFKHGEADEGSKLLFDMLKM